MIASISRTMFIVSQSCPDTGEFQLEPVFDTLQRGITALLLIFSAWPRAALSACWPACRIWQSGH